MSPQDVDQTFQTFLHDQCDPEGTREQAVDATAHEMERFFCPVSLDGRSHLVPAIEVLRKRPILPGKFQKLLRAFLNGPLNPLMKADDPQTLSLDGDAQPSLRKKSLSFRTDPTPKGEDLEPRKRAVLKWHRKA